MTESKVFGKINIFSDEGRCRVDVGWMSTPHGILANQKPLVSIDVH